MAEFSIGLDISMFTCNLLHSNFMIRSRLSTNLGACQHGSFRVYPHAYLALATPYSVKLARPPATINHIVRRHLHMSMSIVEVNTRYRLEVHWIWYHSCTPYGNRRSVGGWKLKRGNISSYPA